MCDGLLERFDKSATMDVSAVFNTREHVDSLRVFWKGSFWAFKQPHFSESVTSQIFKL